VNADRRAVVAGVDLRVGQWRVALVAQAWRASGLIFTGLSPSCIAVEGAWRRTRVRRERRSKNASEGVMMGSLRRDDRAPDVVLQRCAVDVDGVAAQATGWRIWRPSRHRGNSTGPWLFNGVYEVADGAVEMHAVAAQTVVHQVPFVFCFLSRKQRLIAHRVRARGPGGELLGMATAGSGRPWRRRRRSADGRSRRLRRSCDRGRGARWSCGTGRRRERVAVAFSAGGHCRWAEPAH